MVLIEKYAFIFLISFIWIIFACVSDIRRREVPNWLNFSLIAFSGFYVIFYSLLNKDLMFFVYALCGFVVFFGIANLFYYSGVFAGGDAKLLMGLGIIWPYTSFIDIGIYAGVFVFSLMLIGAIYSLIYSVFLIFRNVEGFRKEIKRLLVKWRFVLVLFFVFGFILILFSLKNNLILYSISLLLLIPFLYIYLKAIEKSCLIKLVDPKKLTEGDWIVSDIKVGNRTIKKSVHGLSLKEIEFLRRKGKKVIIKEGIPFVPAFLFAFIFMVFFCLVLYSQFVEFFLSLF